MLGCETKDEMQYHGRSEHPQPHQHITDATATAGKGTHVLLRTLKAAVRPVVAPGLQPGKQTKVQDPGRGYQQIPGWRAAADAGTKAKSTRAARAQLAAGRP